MDSDSSLPFCFITECTIDGVKDIVFLIDTSYYTGTYEFQMIRELVDNITISVKLNTPESSVGVILFDYYARIQFDLEEHTNLSTLSPAINPGLPYFFNGYSRNTAAALNLLLSSAQNGSLGIRNETSHIAIVITGGRSNSIYSTQSAAAALHAANIFDVYAIGYNSADINELNTIANNPNFVYFTNFYNRYDVEESRMNITDQLCSCKKLLYYTCYAFCCIFNEYCKCVMLSLMFLMHLCYYFLLKKTIHSYSYVHRY